MACTTTTCMTPSPSWALAPSTCRRCSQRVSPPASGPSSSSMPATSSCTSGSMRTAPARSYHPLGSVCPAYTCVPRRCRPEAQACSPHVQVRSRGAPRVTGVGAQPAPHPTVEEQPDSSSHPSPAHPSWAAEEPPDMQPQPHPSLPPAPLPLANPGGRTHPTQVQGPCPLSPGPGHSPVPSALAPGEGLALGH